FERGWVERRLDAAVGANALTYRQAQPARHELLGRRHAEVVAIVLQPLAHLDDIAVAFGGEETEPCALVFEERIRRDGRAVDDALGVAKQRGAVDPEAAGQLRKTFEHAKRGILRGRRDFGERRQTAFVDRDKIGESAAESTPMRYMRQLSTWLTKALAMSSEVAAGSRVVGSPQPPQPADSSPK